MKSTEVYVIPLLAHLQPRYEQEQTSIVNTDTMPFSFAMSSAGTSLVARAVSYLDPDQVPDFVDAQYLDGYLHTALLTALVYDTGKKAYS